MNNPHAPTIHMNIGDIKTEKKQWLSGGYDFTPMRFIYEEDKTHFYAFAKKASLLSAQKFILIFLNKLANIFIFVIGKKRVEWGVFSLIIIIREYGERRG